MAATEPSNKFDSAVLKQFVGDIVRHESDMASKRGEYMKYCRDKRELINQTLDRAAAAGVPRKELRAVLKIHKLERKIEDVRDDVFENGDIDTLDMIKDALGDLADLPLGQAAIDKSPAGQAQKAVAPDDGSTTDPQEMGRRLEEANKKVAGKRGNALDDLTGGATH